MGFAKRLMRRGAAMAAVLILVVSAMPAGACTGIKFDVALPDGSAAPIQARTMEFGPDVMGFRLLSVPPGYAYTGCGGNICGPVIGVAGLAWKTRYLFVGFSPQRDGLVVDGVADGMNEKGLAVGGFYHMGFEEYAPSPRPGKTIANTDVVTWLLGSFARVDEVMAAIRDVDVAQFVHPKCTKVTCPQLHYLVTDATGKSIVIEYKDGKPVVFENIGAITNNPTYDWHVTNLRNYLDLQAASRGTVKIGGKFLSQLGNGTGSIGLPGDFTPPSRFVRAMFFVSTVTPGTTTLEDGINKTFKILNSFDIPEGSVLSVSPTGAGTIKDTTEWTSLSDLKRLRYYYHTQTNRAVRMIEVDKLPRDRFLALELPTQETVINVTREFKKAKR